MKVVIEITSGPGAGRKQWILDGQSIHVGRSEGAEFVVADDKEMSDVHFAVKFRSGECELHDVGSTNGVAVNGAQVDVARIHDGDQILAGQTRFSIQMEGPAVRAAPRVTARSETAVVAEDSDVGILSQSAQAPCRHFELDQRAHTLIDGDISCGELLDWLIARDLGTDAIQLLAHILPVRHALWWVCQCERQRWTPVTTGERQARMNAEQWAMDPSEENRRIALQSAESLEFRAPVGLAAGAGFWASVEGDPSPEKEQMAATALGGALLLGSMRFPNPDVPTVLRDFGQWGAQIARQVEPWRTAQASARDDDDAALVESDNMADPPTGLGPPTFHVDDSTSLV